MTTSTVRRKPTVPLSVESLEDRITPGAGTFADGRFNFSVAVLFDATATQLTTIRDRFQRASNVLLDATDGGHCFGEITVMNNASPAAALRADFLIHPESGRAIATAGLYGLPGSRINMFFPDNFTAARGIDGDAYTITHEFVHHAYGILDEYAGPATNAAGQFIDKDGNVAANYWDAASSETAENAPPEAESPALSYSLMDNYLTRGGRAFGSTYTLNELSVPSNHDPDGDTWQTAYWGESDWETIANSRYPLTVPAGLPVDAPPAGHTVAFHTIADAAEVEPRLMFVIDRSGSMTSFDRLTFAKGGARAVVEGTVPSGPSLGLVSFATTSRLDYGLNVVDTAAEETALKNLIDGLTATGLTNITAGLNTGLGQLPDDAVSSLANTLILISDGDNTEDPNPETVIPALKAKGIAVLAIGVGTEISPAGEATLQKIARDTGGTYLRAGNAGNDSFEVLRSFNWYQQGVFGSAPVAESAPATLSPGGSSRFSAPVEVGAAQADFLVNIEQPDIFEFHQTNVTLRSPSGRIITEAVAAADPNIDFLDERYVKGFRVRSPEAGNWEVIAERPFGNTNRVQHQVFVTTLGTNLVVSVRDDTVAYPEPITIQAVPYSCGEAVVGATVTGHVIRPNGTRVAVTLHDDGRPDHGDAIANDGQYSTLFNQYSSQGVGAYSIELKAVAGAGDRTVAGEEIHGSSPSNENPVQPFTRMGSTTAVVTGVPSTIQTQVVQVQIQQDQPTVVGKAFQYTVTVVNRGGQTATGQTATGLTARQSLPVGLRVLNKTTSQGGVTQENNKLTFAVGSLAAGQTATMTVTVVADRPGSYLSTAKVESHDHPIASFADGVDSAAFVVRANDAEPPPPVPPQAVPPQAIVATILKKKGRTSVRVHDAASGAFKFQVTPFGKFRAKLALLTMDLNGNGDQDLVVAEGRGGQGRLKVYDGTTGALLRSFRAFKGLLPGARVSLEARDANSDGVADLVVKVKAGKKSRTMAFSGLDLTEIPITLAGIAAS